MSNTNIPPARYGGKPSIYGPIIKSLKVGQSHKFKTESEQHGCYNYARRNGYSVKMRKIGSDFHVFVAALPKKRGAIRKPRTK